MMVYRNLGSKKDDMDGKITKRQMALGVSMVYGGLVAAMAALNYTDVMLIVVLVGAQLSLGHGMWRPGTSSGSSA